MANDQNRSHTFSDDGFSLGDAFGNPLLHKSGGTSSPVGVLAPTVASLYYQTNGDIWFHPGSGGSGAWKPILPFKYRMTAVQSSTVVAPAALTQLTSVSLPVGNYRFKVLIKIRSAAAATGYGLRFQNGSATVSDILAAWRLPANVDFSTTQNISYSQRLLTDNNIAGTVGAANTDYMAVGEGFFTVSVAGTVAIQLRSETAGTAVTAGIGSNLIIEALP